MVVDRLDDGGRKNGLLRHPSPFKASADVQLRINRLKCSKMAAENDALLQLPEIRSFQLSIQFGLTRQDDLEELSARVLEVAEQAHFL